VRFARPCTRGGFCDASGAEAGFLPGRYCACRCVVSRAGIRIIIPRACQALCSELSVLPLGEVASVGGPKMQKDGFPGRDSWEVAALGRPVL